MNKLILLNLKYFITSTLSLLLSFRDLVDRGYKVRINMPSLEMNVTRATFAAGGTITSEMNQIINQTITNGTGSVTENETINITTPENATDINIINASNTTRPAIINAIFTVLSFGCVCAVKAGTDGTFGILIKPSIVDRSGRSSHEFLVSPELFVSISSF